MGERTLISAENEAGQCALCEPDVEGMMNDLISRQAAIESIRECAEAAHSMHT